MSSQLAPPPPWDSARPYLTGAALRAPLPEQARAEGGPALPMRVQREMAVDDALYSLLALRCARVEAGGDGEVAMLAAAVSALARSYGRVAAFCEGVRAAGDGPGFVRQAVGVALAELLDEYRAFVVRLEDVMKVGDLSLQKLVYYVQPSARSMAVLGRVVDVCEGKRGGELLGALYGLAAGFVGDEEVRSVMEFIIGRAAAPVLDILHVWVQRGVVDDPYGEFFIKENHRYRRGALREDTASVKFWELRYTVNRDNLPEFLAPFVENVLRAGKYLNVLRECGVDTAVAIAEANLAEDGLRAAAAAESPTYVAYEGNDQSSRLHLSGKVLLGPKAARMIAAVVDRSFAASSRALMSYLRDDISLMGRLRSMRRYFLLEQGDFLVHFFDAAAPELAKKRSDVSLSKLGSLLELSVRTSVSASDPFHDDLSCTLFDHNLASQILIVMGGGSGAAPASAMPSEGMISGYDAFAFDYRLQWPMSLIISSMEVLKYQLMFRYLFHCKHVERELEECWRVHSRAKGPLRGLRTHLMRSYALRNRMLQFIRNMLYYTVADVVEPNWLRLEAALKRAKTIDEIIWHHTNFLDTSLSQSMLSNEKHLQVFHSITQTCLAFARYTESFSRYLSPQEVPATVEVKLNARNYPAAVAKFETSFDVHLGKLLDGLSAVSKKRANTHLANLVERLDVGGFYERSVDRTMASFGSFGA